MLRLLDRSVRQTYVPAAFFIHFDQACHFGQAAVEKHLEYFRHTGMDFVKIQYERVFPPIPDIKRPEDWRNGCPRTGWSSTSRSWTRCEGWSRRRRRRP